MKHTDRPAQRKRRQQAQNFDSGIKLPYGNNKCNSLRNLYRFNWCLFIYAPTGTSAAPLTGRKIRMPYYVPNTNEFISVAVAMTHTQYVIDQSGNGSPPFI
ncbi:hypothetical protein D3871_22635 [Noviherbaspirillum saxi]|uniref:Uncharacterized protein n=1 Tax=Noviherbaspirillum saxi TaxID=2320863 RepID=A0A3A3FLS6_9BURK|nr:hypothetical protein D3871_22635 [Noviherbaspirillum saxi]